MSALSSCPGAVPQCPPWSFPPQNQTPWDCSWKCKAEGPETCSCKNGWACHWQFTARPYSLEPCPPPGQLPGSTLSGGNSGDPFWRDCLQFLPQCRTVHNKALFRALIPRGPDMTPTVSNMLYVPCESLLLPPEKGQRLQAPGVGGAHLHDLCSLLRAQECFPWGGASWVSSWSEALISNMSEDLLVRSCEALPIL